jgi:predicted PolB exonuclease-like 3'-5' exonuclease
MPGKLDGMDGAQVEAMAEAGCFDEIAAYCLGDVIVSFRLMPRFALVRGELDQEQLAASEASLEQAIQRQLERWPPPMAMR